MIELDVSLRHNRNVDAVPAAEHPSDMALWEQAAHGDGPAFGQLFERHADRVYNHCFQRIGWDVATELTSVVFLEAWRRRREVRVTTLSILPWLLAVANNVVSQQRRTQRRHRQALARLPAVPASADHADDVAARVDDERTMQRILAVLAGMSEAEQDVLSLCVWSDISYEEAAAVLCVPVGTIRSRLSRARKRLRALTTDMSTSGTAAKAGD